jgi:hypothetical protein
MKLLNNKPVQALLAVGPIILFAFSFMVYFAFFISAISGTYKIEPLQSWLANWLDNVNLFLVLSLGVSAFFIISTVYFVLHAAQNPLLENGNMRIVWILIIILLSGIGNFIYWLLEIRNKRQMPVIGDSLMDKKQSDWSRGLYMKS